jgi:hypothetical protein
MTNMIPFESKTLPARFANRKTEKAAMPVWAVGGGFPSISIKGKVFHIARGEDRQLVTKPGAEDEPASSLEVVIVRAAKGVSKVFYATGYVEGSDSKPTCYSNDGVAPATDAAEPQAKQCATCAQNQWGARITESGKKGKACSDSVRLAVAPAGNPNDPMLLRVPATSIAALREFYKRVNDRGAQLHDVVTKIGFDYSVAHPALTFREIGFVSDEQYNEVVQVGEGELAKRIVGEIAEVPAEAPPEAFEQAAPAPKPAAPTPAPTPKPAVKKSSALAAAEAAAEDAPVAPVKVEKKPAAVVSLEADLEEALADLDFDDE